MYLTKATMFVNHRHLPVILPGLEAFVDWRNCAGLRGCCSRWGHDVGAHCGRWNKDQTAKLNFTSTLDCESAEIHDHIEIYSPLLGVPGFFQKTWNSNRRRFFQDAEYQILMILSIPWNLAPVELGVLSLQVFSKCQVVLWDWRARNISSNKDSKGSNSIRFDLVESTKIQKNAYQLRGGGSP